MNKKRWVLLILCILLLAGYWKLFYKTYSETAVSKNADYIIALDVKRAANTIIWNVITTPALWKKISFSSAKTDRVSWEDMVKLPDYVFAFHISNQPMNAWYTVLEVNDKEAFSKGLLQYHFEKGERNQYFSKELGIEFIQSGDKLLVGNFAVADKNLLWQVGEDLFVKKQFVSKEILKKNIDAKSQLAIQIAKNNFLQEDAIIKANFDKNKIVVDAAFTPQARYSFAENNFSYSSNSLFASGFTQPSAPVYALLTDSVKTTISKAVNFDIDSLLHQNNSHYNLDIAAIQPRVDSAISYTYDDNFNPIEKVVVNNVLEPLLNFSVKGDGVSNVYTYWNNKGKLEKTAAGDLFVPMPFVKAYCHKKSEKELTITANNYQPSATNTSTNCIFFLNMQLTKIPAALLKYLPDELLKSIANVGSVEMDVKKYKQQIVVHVSFNKKKNDLPLVDF